MKKICIGQIWQEKNYNQRVIRLTLAKDTTETECGNCRFIDPDGDHEVLQGQPCCQAFGMAHIVGGKRLPECIAAESK